MLTFAAEPDGAPPPVLCAGAAGDFARRPAGGDPMLVLRRRADVLRSLSDTAHFGMAGVTGDGELARSPLTGAEMQSPDGGLLNMNPPPLRAYRQRINGLFSRSEAARTQAAATALAAALVGSLRPGTEVDARAGFAEPFAAGMVCQAMGVPPGDWERINGFSRMAFGVVPGPDAVGATEAAWAELYDYFAPLAAAGGPGLAARLAHALNGFTADQVTHVIGTVSNGFGAVLPVLCAGIAEVARRPGVVAACLRGTRTWEWAADALLARRAIFPVALPRVALADTWLGDRLVTEGAVVLPSLIAAAHDPAAPASASIAFGAGPHFCPGAALTRIWLASALAALFTAFPAARLAGSLAWQPGTLSVPREIPLALT